MTQTRECPSCALEYEYEAGDPPEVCPYCGYEFPKQKTSTAAFAWIFAALLLLWACYELITYLA